MKDSDFDPVPDTPNPHFYDADHLDVWMVSECHGAQTDTNAEHACVCRLCGKLCQVTVIPKREAWTMELNLASEPLPFYAGTEEGAKDAAARHFSPDACAVSPDGEWFTQDRYGEWVPLS